ncbi:MAG: hypothetical protein Kow0063_16670 [Anaerolineae bacterium]
MSSHVKTSEYSYFFPPTQNKGLFTRRLYKAFYSGYLYPVFIFWTRSAAAMSKIPNVNTDSVTLFPLEYL